MKIDINSLKDTFKISYETFEASRVEEAEIRNLYHNRHYTKEQLLKLKSRGQPAETFNIIKLYTRLLVGYYSTIVNTVKVNPRQQEDILTSMLLNDLVQYTFETNHLETEGDKMKLDGFLSGIMVSHIEVYDTGDRDNYNRPVNRIRISHVPTREILLDPMSTAEDYSDARYIHRFKWVSREFLISMLSDEFSKQKAINIIAKLNAYENHLNQNDTEFGEFFTEHFRGYNKEYDNYLLVHSIMTDENNKVWSIYWCGDEILIKKEVTYREVKFPYRVQRINTSDTSEYYGLFRDIKESQHAINQALIKLQLMASTQKAFVEKNAVENMAKFTDNFNRVNSVIPVNKLNGIKIENSNQDVATQYAIIDKALERIQKVLSINDSFLGQAYASDSGRKVKLQQNATIVALRYVTTKVEQFYRLLGWDIVNLIKQYYTAEEALRITDSLVGERWIEINKPLVVPTGNINVSTGQPEETLAFEEVLDPASGEPLIDEDGRYVIAPISTGESDISFTNVDISIDTSAYNDEDEKNNLMLEAILQGPVGQTLLQLNPAGYLKAAELSVKTVKTKNSLQIANILAGTAEMLTQQQMAMQQAPQQVAPEPQGFGSGNPTDPGER